MHISAFEGKLALSSTKQKFLLTIFHFSLLLNSVIMLLVISFLYFLSVVSPVVLDEDNRQ